MLGHKDAAMTLNVYASLFEDDLDDVSNRLDAALLEAAAARMRPDPPAEIIELPERTARISSDQAKRVSAPSRIRTCDTRFRKPLLYPLSYGGLARCRQRGGMFQQSAPHRVSASAVCQHDRYAETDCDGCRHRH
jgi:hypothetical protein